MKKFFQLLALLSLVACIYFLWPSGSEKKITKEQVDEVIVAQKTTEQRIDSAFESPQEQKINNQVLKTRIKNVKRNIPPKKIQESEHRPRKSLYNFSDYNFELPTDFNPPEEILSEELAHLEKINFMKMQGRREQARFLNKALEFGPSEIEEVFDYSDNVAALIVEQGTEASSMKNKGDIWTKYEANMTEALGSDIYQEYSRIERQTLIDISVMLEQKNSEQMK